LRLRCDAVMNKGAVVEDGLAERDGDGVNVLGLAVAVLELGSVAVVDEQGDDERVSGAFGEVVIVMPIDKVAFVFVEAREKAVLLGRGCELQPLAYGV